ncbi:MAG: hypothetical protein IIA89_13430 [Chloroflexi bacterium]|nr:hypothetical protein [Chloroflexota bacterium]
MTPEELAYAKARFDELYALKKKELASKPGLSLESNPRVMAFDAESKKLSQEFRKHLDEVMQPKTLQVREQYTAALAARNDALAAVADCDKAIAKAAKQQRDIAREVKYLSRSAGVPAPPVPASAAIGRTGSGQRTSYGIPG